MVGLSALGVVVLGMGPLAGGVKLGFEPMVLVSTGREGVGFGNLENFSASRAI